MTMPSFCGIRPFTEPCKLDSKLQWEVRHTKPSFVVDGILKHMVKGQEYSVAQLAESLCFMRHSVRSACNRLAKNGKLIKSKGHCFSYRLK